MTGPVPGLLLYERAQAVLPFTAEWSLHPSVVVGTGLLGALYFWGIGPARRRYHLGPPASPWRVASFVLALLVLLGSLDGPIHDLSDDYLFSIHMAQHMLLTLVLAPLLIAGTPGWLLRPLVRPTWVQRIGRALTRPLVAGGLFTAVFAAWHLVPLYDRMMSDHDLHILSHLMFIVTSVIVWWPVMSPLEEVPPLPLGPRMLYLFIVSIPMQLIAAMITMADHPLYEWYVHAPRTWGLSPLDDQRYGGLLMWVPGNLWMFGAISVIFFRWAREER